MPALPAVRRSTDLYPPELDPALREFILTIATGARTMDGALELRRALTLDERVKLTSRAKEILPWLDAATSAALKRIVQEMFLGWPGQKFSVDEAKAVSAQYVSTLAGLPEWAVVRATQRFLQGSVEPREVGAKTLDRSFPPAAAQIHMVAKEIVRTVSEEARRIDMTINGAAARPEPTAEERARCIAAIERWRADAGIRMQAGAQRDHEEYRRTAEEVDALHRQRVIAEYVAAGLDPPEECEGKMLVSLPMMLEMGWTIEQKRGEKVLVAPAGLPPLRRSLGYRA